MKFFFKKRPGTSEIGTSFSCAVLGLGSEGVKGLKKVKRDFCLVMDSSCLYFLIELKNKLNFQGKFALKN